MEALLPSIRLRKEFSDLTRVDITNIICLLILSFICAYVFLETVYRKYLKDSTLKISVATFMTGFKDRQSVQMAG